LKSVNQFLPRYSVLPDVVLLTIPADQRDSFALGPIAQELSPGKANGDLVSNECPMGRSFTDDLPVPRQCRKNTGTEILSPGHCLRSVRGAAWNEIGFATLLSTR
jgi:hypothetical protein